MTGTPTTSSSRRPDLIGWILAIVGIVLAGATAFGLWHVVVGGFVNGNARAGLFGLGLASVAGLALLVVVWSVRRRAARAPG